MEICFGLQTNALRTKMKDKTYNVEFFGPSPGERPRFRFA